MAEDNIVLLIWKKFCCYNNYRNPTIFALELLKKYPNSNFIVDARNGFDDDFAKKNYREELTGDHEHLEKIINGHVKFYTKDELIDLADKNNFRIRDFFNTEIYFPSNRTEKYIKIVNDIDESIIDSYNIRINNGQISITIYNQRKAFVIVFTKSIIYYNVYTLQLSLQIKIIHVL